MAVIAAHNAPLGPLHNHAASNNSNMCPPSLKSIVGQDDFGASSTQRLPLRECEQSPHHLQECDACPHCQDMCSNPQCCFCSGGSADCNPFSSSSENTSYTMCQVSRHCTVDSAWLVVGDTIYDATFYISRHPGGSESILKKSGGRVDCTVDFDFHSKKAQAMWRKHKVGKLRPCVSTAQQIGIDSQCTIS